jgi:hypothetical protein
LTLLSVTASLPITQTGSNPLQWTVANLPTGESGVITLSTRVDSDLGLTTITNTAGITSTIPDTTPGDNTAQVSNASCALDIEVQNNNISGPGSLNQAIGDACEGATITFSSDMTITLVDLFGPDPYPFTYYPG